MMRPGLVVSSLGHGAVLVAGLIALGALGPLPSPPQKSVIVDIVTPAEVPKETRRPDTETEKSAKPDAPEPPKADAATPHDDRQAAAPHPPSGAAHATQQAGERQQTAPGAAPQTGRAVVTDTVYAAPVYLPELMFSGEATKFDAPAQSAANISSADIAAFRAHLQKCWSPKAGDGGDRLRVVLRIALAPDGSLAGAPMLVEATASPEGPALVQGAMQALERCAPFRFLPADKYDEWKLLDLSFSPQGLAEGRRSTAAR